MRVAALYDIHGNLPALERVLDEVRAAAPDLIVIGGDVAGGPAPRETMEALERLETPALHVRGNGDRAPEPFESALLDDGRLAVMAAWPLTAVAAVDGLGEVLFCHASPHSDEEILTAISPDERLAPMFAGLDQQLIVCGHVHVQYDRLAAGRRIVNAGSVGMAYEGRDDVACWCLLGPEVELRREVYDRGRFDHLLATSGYPGAEAFDAATAAQATAHFEALASGRPS
jgi:putative phosphoesterase